MTIQLKFKTMSRKPLGVTKAYHVYANHTRLGEFHIAPQGLVVISTNHGSLGNVYTPLSMTPNEFDAQIQLLIRILVLYELGVDTGDDDRIDIIWPNANTSSTSYIVNAPVTDPRARR